MSTPNLPPGWEEVYDDNFKQYYYYAASSGESVWEVPTTAAPGMSGAEQAPISKASTYPEEEYHQPPTADAHHPRDYHDPRGDPRGDPRVSPE